MILFKYKEGDDYIMDNVSLKKIKWNEYISNIIDFLDKDDEFKKQIKDLLKNFPVMTISSYKKIYEVEAEDEWKYFKSQNRNLFSSFFQRVYDVIKNYGIERTKLEYGKYLKIVSNVLEISYDDLKSELISLDYYLKNNDKEQERKTVEILKEYYKKFIILYKKNFTDDYVSKKLENIKPYFKEIIASNKRQMSEMDFISVLKRKKDLYDKLLNMVNANSGLKFDKLNLDKLIMSILNKNDQEILDLLNIQKPEFYDSIDQMRALRRLRINYSKRLINEINPDLHKIVETFLNNPIENESLKKYFNKNQILLLNDVVNLMKESKSSIDFSRDDLFISAYNELTVEDKEVLNKFKSDLKYVEELKKLIFNMYKRENDTYNYLYNIVELEEKNESDTLINSNSSSFNDSNYVLNNYDYMFDKNAIINFINEIDENKFIKLNNYEYMKLKDLLTSDKLLCPMLYGNLKQIKLSDLINNFHDLCNVMKYSNINKNNLDLIFKKLNVYKYATEEQIRLLGLPVVEKIINNNQFMDVKITDVDIKNRIIKAEDLMKRAKAVTLSTVPYITVENNGITISRYLNDDPKILTSGIDTNSCFRLSANDNDFLYYTILNKNGFVLKITDENGNILSKIAGIRRNNIIELNGVRNSENSNLISSKEQYVLYKNILDALEIYGQKLIECTKDTETPIDFVVINKAGILECPEFSDRYEILAQHLFDNPIDTTNEDWKNFVHTFDNCEENFLQQSSDDTAFTTDFGHYPVVLLSKRKGKNLLRLFDISYNDPKPIYERPKTPTIYEYKDKDKTDLIKGLGSVV